VPIEPFHGGVYDTDCDRAYRCIDRFANKPGEAELVCFAETTALRTASGPVDDQGEGANATNYLHHLMKLAPRTTRTTSETVKSKVVSATFETGAGRDNEPIAHEICLRLRKQALDHENKTLRNLPRFGDDVPWRDYTSFSSALCFLPVRVGPAVVGYEAVFVLVAVCAYVEGHGSKTDANPPFVDESRTSI
jgi:hypothetical protein